MPFTDKQAKALRSKLAHHHVKTRSSNGSTISYVEGWHVISEANRIFGFDCWDRSTLSPKCISTTLQQGQTVCFYSTRVRITVRAGDGIIVREGIGTGTGRSPSPDAAHEIALKSAETDATKRALATFGNPFGLALYDKEQSGVTRQRDCNKSASENPRTYDLVISGQGSRALDGSSFIRQALIAIEQIQTLDSVYAFWEENRKSLVALRAAHSSDGQNPVEDIFAALKQRAQILGGPRKQARTKQIAVANHATSSSVIVAKSTRLPILKERRIRDKDHLKFVASQPCLICGRRPTQAHHLRFAQPQAMAMKVSDEFTVPLCNVHHDQLHRAGDERAWWARHGILDPLKVADRLWNTPKQDRLRWMRDPEDASKYPEHAINIPASDDSGAVAQRETQGQSFEGVANSDLQLGRASQENGLGK